MANWCNNSIMIPKEFKMLFMRKFTKYVRTYGERVRTLDFNKILRMPVLPEAWQRKWLEENWSTTHNAFDVEFIDHHDGGYAGKFEIVFVSKWSPVSEKLVEQIAKRLHCNVEHVFMDESYENYGIREFIFDDGEDHDEPELFFMQEAEDNEDNYETIVTRFFGCSDLANELIQERSDASVCL